MAWNTNTNAYQTGDSTNHTLRFIRDATESTPTNSPTEVDSTNAPGAYNITWTSAEGTTNILWVGGKSSTANVVLIPMTIGFENLPTLPTTILTVGSGVNVTQILGATVVTSAAQIGVNVFTIGGVVAQGSLAAGSVNVVQIQGTATQTSLAQLGVNLVTWEGLPPLALTSGLVQTTVSGIVNANIVQVSGASAVTSAAQIGVNVVSFAGNPAGVTNIDRSTRSIALGTVSNASTTTTIYISTIVPAQTTASQFVGRIVNFDANTVTANLRGQSTNIVAGGTSSGGSLNVTALTDAPVLGDSFSVT